MTLPLANVNLFRDPVTRSVSHTMLKKIHVSFSHVFYAIPRCSGLYSVWTVPWLLGESKANWLFVQYVQISWKNLTVWLRQYVVHSMCTSG